MSYQPPFQLTHTMTRKVANIGELIGTWKAANQHQLASWLQRDNRIKTIQASLAVEQNTLTLEQVTAVIEGKTFWGCQRQFRKFVTLSGHMKLWISGTHINWTICWRHMPVETVIKHRQQTYYQLLTESDQKSDCSAFIEFLLQAIEDSLQEAISTQPATDKTLVQSQVQTPDLILQQLSANPSMALADVSLLIGKSVSVVERAVAKLKQQGKLEFIGPKKGGRWQVVKE